MRADVDNLGQAIVSGFDGKVSGLSRTATLSRHLSIFFKYFIRDILEHGEYSLSGETKVHRRNAAIIYSGGDDVFIVGAWNEVIELAVDLRNKFKRYTQGTLSLSAGIGMYGASLPDCSGCRRNRSDGRAFKIFAGKGRGDASGRW